MLANSDIQAFARKHRIRQREITRRLRLSNSDFKEILGEELSDSKKEYLEQVVLEIEEHQMNRIRGYINY